MTELQPSPQSNVSDRSGEDAVRRFYERAPYPDLGARLKRPDAWLSPLVEYLGPERTAGPVRYLDAGCGTGHSVVGLARAMPHWQAHGLDLSAASLDIARRLAEKHGAAVTFARGSYLDPLPFDGPFDVIASFGSIHHSADPAAAIRNLLDHLVEDGFFVMHLYGKNLDAGKFVMREILDILAPDLDAVDERFRLYEAVLAARRKRPLDVLLDLSPRVVLRTVRDAARRVRRRVRGESWSPSWRERYRAPDAAWQDHFCHPLERAYDVRDVRSLAEAAGLDVLAMLNLGRERPDRVPPGWEARVAALDKWSRWRLMELLDTTARSVLLIGRKASGREARDR